VGNDFQFFVLFLLAALSLAALVILLRRNSRSDTAVLTQLRQSTEQSLGAERAQAARLEMMQSGLQDLRREQSELAGRIGREGLESRLMLEGRLAQLAETQAARLAEIQAAVNEQLHKAVEKQMEGSFRRVGRNAVARAAG
jgi:DNA recombination protein RmuC